MIDRKESLQLGWLAFAAVIAAPAIVCAQTVAPEEEDTSTVVVTGSARPERRFDVAYAVNSLSRDEIEKIAPKSYADLLGNVPGIQVEATGGEVQNVTRVRGIPTDRGYLYFQQDGLPLYQELDGVFFNGGEGMHRYDLMTDRIEVVRGGPAPIFASDAAAIANNITVTGTAQTRGKAQLTLGDTGLYRADVYQAGPVSDRTYYAIGGFVRYHDGYRDNGFPNDQGGQVRANLKHDLDNGWIKISGVYVNDHNVFYLPIPIADPRNPSVSLDRYIDYFKGTMNSPALRDVTIKYLDGTGGLHSLNRDLANGRYMRFGNVGLAYEGTFSDWLVSLKSGFTKGNNSFDAFYSTTNPVDATTFANSYLAAARAAFGASVNRLGYTVAASNGAMAYDPSSASGLVMSGQYRVAESDFYSDQADLSVTRQFETGLGKHDFKAGIYGSRWGTSSFQAFQDYLIEVAGQPRTLDLVAYSASGAVLGSVTDRGVLRYATTLNQGKADAHMIAAYINDTWDITDRLRLDAGVRHEWYSYDGFAAFSTSADLGDATTLADNATRAFTGAINDYQLNPKATNWTAGVNYDLNSALGAYARVSRLEVPPSSTVALNTAPVAVTSRANQYEVGLKALFGGSYLYITGFLTKFDPLNASFPAFNPQTGRNDQTVTFIGTAETKGVEMDGRWRLAPLFSIAGSVTVSDPQYKNLANSAGADPGAVNGKQIIREPKVYGNVRPSFDFGVGPTQVSIYGSYEYVGRRYVDFFNQTALPSYGDFGAGATLTLDTWQFQIVGDNLTNAKGLTEGNTRTDTLTGQGAADAIYGRPVFGRNVRVIMAKTW